MVQSNFYIYNQNLLKSVLLLTLAVSGNFVGNTLGCKTQYYLTNNMYFKHTLLIFIIYFTVNYTSTENENPSLQIAKAFLIWFCFILFTKQNIYFTGLSAGILMISYIIDTFSIHYKKISEDTKLSEDNKDKNKKIYEILNTTTNILFIIGIIIIIIGFFYYLKLRHGEYKDKFNIFTFLFGKINCKSLTA
jgi:hypothetical protein